MFLWELRWVVNNGWQVMGGRKGALGPVLAGHWKSWFWGLFWPKSAIFFDFDSLFWRAEPQKFLSKCFEKCRSIDLEQLYILDT